MLLFCSDNRLYYVDTSRSVGVLTRRSNYDDKRKRIFHMTNFYVDEEGFGNPTYIIKQDKLIKIDYKFSQKIIIEGGASNIRFQTDTDYDIGLNMANKLMKSARKR